MMEVDLLSATSREWSSLLEDVAHDFYHLPAYAELCAKLDHGTARAVLVREGPHSLLLPLIARPIPLIPNANANANANVEGSVRADALGAWDALSPYGYPGPLVRAEGLSEEDAATFITMALDAASERLSAEQCVSLFVRLHPLLGRAAAMRTGLANVKDALVVQHGETVYVDLRKSEAEHWSETTSGHRNEINRAIKAGHQAYFDEDFRHADRFVAIYQATMSRVGAAAYYFFDREYLMGLREALGPRLKLAVVEINGNVAATGLFVETGKIVQYHLSGTDERFVRERPTKLMLHFVRRWARERGATWLHLGGGVGGHQDSLFKFKAGFSKERSPFYTLRLVTNKALYGELSRGKATATAAPESSPHDVVDDAGRVLASLDGFFPLYRRPDPISSSEK